MKNNLKKQIVVYPGFFNPLHLQHEKIIRLIINSKKYDQIWIFVNGNTNHKSPLLSYQLRKTMIKKIFQDEKKVVVWNQPAPYITNHLFTFLKKKKPQSKYEFWLLMGSDNWNNTSTWDEFTELKTQTNFLIVERSNFLINQISSNRSIRKLKIKPTEINSTDIRNGLHWKWLSSKVRTMLFEKKCFFDHILRKNLSNDKYQHVKKVFQMAVLLNKKYNLKQSIKNLEIAALFHDLCKNWTKNKQLKFVQNHQLDQSVLNTLPFPIWHSKTSAWYLKQALCYQNKQVFDAIWAHTSADWKMTTFMKIIFVADKIEWTKTTNGAKKLRTLIQKISFSQLFKATLKNVIQTLEKKRKKLSPKTLKAQKYYL